MQRRYHFRSCRIDTLRLTICSIILYLSWLTVTTYKKKIIEHIEYDQNFIDDHLYPPPWYMTNWTINDYFLRKETLKQIEDRDAVKQDEKVIIENAFSNSINGKRENYVILEYTTVFSKPKFCQKTSESIFGKQCSYQNCRYTCDRNSSKTADVLLMHRSDIHFDQLPLERDPDQIWLFWHDEPGGVQKEFISYQFNWTISYRFNSEMNIGAYGLTILRHQPLSSQELVSYVKEQFEHRKSSAVWFVSNCQPKARLNYFHELSSSYPSITVYGPCVSQNLSQVCHRQSSCEKSELSNHKFYLAFESQSCRDYITEKFWRSLVYGTIPIVFGPRHRLTVERIAPPNSFIYTGDFPSVSQLAEHLNEIGRNRTLFMKYHQWRQYYQVLHRPEEIEHYRFCELCYRLNTNVNRIYYQDLNKFFLRDC